jgi:pimeloyl-ACP methyl ester carboxylesterase
VPAIARDAANRRVLAGLERSPGLQTLADRLDDPALPRAYLLGLDTAGDGRAILAVGDPDHATDVVTYVPGVNRGLAEVGGLVGRTDAIAARAAALGPTHRVSAVLWLGYDAPDGLDVALPRAAHGSEAALDSFADGLRASHVGDRSHNTVLGHSYGSLVAGVTARDRGLDADELVLIGSPGVGVDRAAQLHGIPAGHVWAGAAANDPVQLFAPGVGQLAVDALTNLRHPFSAHFGDATPDMFLWHGRNPATEDFGAHIFAADADGGHSGYWQGGALDAIVGITVGAYPATDT